MIPKPLADENAYGCDINAAGNAVLLQLYDYSDGEQVRVRLNVSEVDTLIDDLRAVQLQIKENKPHEETDQG